MKVNTSYLVLKTDERIVADSSKLRGYFGNKFKDKPLFHNHYGDEKFLYSYPLIQYQIIEGQPTVLGIEEGSNLLKESSSEITELKLDKTYPVTEKIIYDKEFNINTSNEEYQYKFLTPWIALNSQNFKKYNTITDWKEKKLFLNKILVGNILSMCKGLGIVVNRRIYVKSNLEETNVKYKSVIMKAFTGEFQVKFKIPDFFGFGKGVSQGFGTVKQIINEE